MDRGEAAQQCELMPLTTLKNGSNSKYYAIYISPQLKKQKKEGHSPLVWLLPQCSPQSGRTHFLNAFRGQSYAEASLCALESLPGV